MKRPGALTLLAATVGAGSLALFLWTVGTSIGPLGHSDLEPFSYWEVQELVIQDARGILRLQRQGEDWVIGETEGKTVDTSRVRAFIGRWEGGFRATRPVNESQPAGEVAATGLEDNPIRVQMVDGKGGSLMDVELGQTLRGGRLYLRTQPGGPAVQGLIPPGPAPSSDPSDWLPKLE